MPKKTKKQAIPLEERLEKALVPEAEQPYEVPENWVWCFSNICFQKTAAKKPTGKTFRYIDIDSIDNRKNEVEAPKILATSKAPSRANREVQQGDTLFSLVRPYLRNIAYIDETLSDCIASTGFFVCRPRPYILPRFLYHLMKSESVVMGLNEHMKGDNSPSIRKDDIENFPFPLPPPSEQRRIVERIESLFDKLDRAKEVLQTALESFELRKAAILHQAFTGELTARWRKENGVDLESWEETTFEQCFVSMQNGLMKRSGASGKATVVIRLANIMGNTIVEDDLRKIVLTDEERKKYRVSKNDILVIRVNGSKDNVGKLILMNNEKSWTFCDHLIRAKPNCQKICADFIVYYSQTRPYIGFIRDNMVSSAGQNTISQKNLNKLKLEIPTLQEQAEIVRILDAVLGKEEKALELCDVIDGIDLLKKSILARAFRGELGTNDPEEESSLTLLGEVLAKET